MNLEGFAKLATEANTLCKHCGERLTRRMLHYFSDPHGFIVDDLPGTHKLYFICNRGHQTPFNEVKVRKVAYVA